MTHKETCLEAIKKWGELPQLVMVMEELAELAQEVSKEYRGKGDLHKLTNEIADVEIMLEQLKIIKTNREKKKNGGIREGQVGQDYLWLGDIVDRKKHEKIERLRRTMKELIE